MVGWPGWPFVVQLRLLLRRRKQSSIGSHAKTLTELGAVDVEKGGEVEEGRDDVGEGEEVHEVAYIGLWAPSPPSVDVSDERDRGAIFGCSLDKATKARKPFFLRL